MLVIDSFASSKTPPSTIGTRCSKMTPQAVSSPMPTCSTALAAFSTLPKTFACRLAAWSTTVCGSTPNPSPIGQPSLGAYRSAVCRRNPAVSESAPSISDIAAAAFWDASVAACR